MTNEEIRIKVAEAMGWTWNEQTMIGGILFRPAWSHDTHGFRYSIHDLPNYPESLDSCAEFEKTLTTEQRHDYVRSLRHITEVWDAMPEFTTTFATASQRCLAYLKTKGLIP